MKALEQSEGYEDAQQIARVITDTLNMEAMASVRVAYEMCIRDSMNSVRRAYFYLREKRKQTALLFFFFLRKELFSIQCSAGKCKTRCV